MITPIILSGGGGSRLWPLSRSEYPKQYLALVGSNTLLQETVQRVSTDSFSQPIIICNHKHRFLAAEQLREIEVTPAHIVLETESHNTAAAIAIACLLKNDPEQLLLVLPADHIIQDRKAFYQAITAARNAAQQGKIVTFGIQPFCPETRYGYIERGEKLAQSDSIFRVASFIEKPNLATAEKLIERGHYYWNSGIFLFKVDAMLNELERLQPTLLENCRLAFSRATRDLDFLRLDSKSIQADSHLSIDSAVMEHTPHAAVVPVDMKWSDIGSWDSLWKTSAKDVAGNVVVGDVITQQVSNSYIRSDGQLVSVLGLDEVVVIATDDAVLVAHQAQMQQMKELVQGLKEQKRSELDQHVRVYRPWGYYQKIDLGQRFQVKRIMVKPGAKTSTQIHYHRSEHWVVVEGIAEVTRGEETFLVHENESVYLPMGVKHRVENPGKIPLHFIEVQSGSYLGEDDIVRLEDVYGRAETLISDVINSKEFVT